MMEILAAEIEAEDEEDEADSDGGDTAIEEEDELVNQDLVKQRVTITDFDH